MFGRHLQAFAPPNALHAVLAHVPASRVQQGGDPAGAVTAVLAGQREAEPTRDAYTVVINAVLALLRQPESDEWICGQSVRPHGANEGLGWTEVSVKAEF